MSKRIEFVHRKRDDDDVLAERERGTKGGEEEYTSGVEPAVRTVDMATAISVGLNGSSGWADCTRGTEIPAPANTPHQDTSCRRIH